MKAQYTQFIGMLLLPVCITACNGQVSSNLRQENAGITNKPGEIRQKLIRAQGVAAGNISCELQDKTGNIWFSTGGEGAYRYDPSTALEARAEAFTNFTTKDGLGSNYISEIIQDKKGNILLGTNKGIYKYNGKTFTTYSDNAILKELPVSSLLEDSDGNLWIGTMNSGVYRYDGKTLTNFLNNDDQPFNLGCHYQSISDILEDKKGNIWLSTWNGGGVWCYTASATPANSSKSFINFLPSADYYILKDSGFSEDGRSQAAKPVDFATYFPRPYSDSASKRSISDDMIFSITEDKAGNLWFATRRHGACRYDGQYFTSFREKEGFVSRGVYDILEDSKGRMWFTTNDFGVWCYDPSIAMDAGMKPFKNFTTEAGLVNNSVFSVLEDKNGNLWFGTRGFGLSRYDGKNFTSFSE